ncbi:uncharacterized protein LOC6582772 isoform X2 [Drosophila mojavensis]|uniref:Uncharacterized protein, isoform B n=1 Tax=Drosophila mojavensis TaxID=7230 RepID=A0A0Q9XFI1_DROMO|nr:uncharacterized protein LOC6582772 isoform X2 [Drosophila mojavensis]KRG06425.1 uncharacterized protein Dmoj_GI16947, isoform B [Drosophila mojavensis]
MTSLRDWKNSLRCNEKLSPKSKSRTAFSCSEKNLDLNFAKPSGSQHAYDRFEVKRKSNTMLRIKNRNDDIAADAVGTTATVALSGSNSPIARPCDCPEEESHELAIPHDYSTYLKAFALIYVLPEEEWKAENIDKLLVEGEELFQASSGTEVADGLRKALSSIYTSVEQRIKRSFKLEGHSFTLELRPSYLGNSNKPADLRPPHIMKHLREVLRAFFRRAHYCLLQHKAGHLLIWRRRNLYFVMDVKGRRPDDLASARPHVAMLICLQTLDNVVHLASNLSGDNPNDAFSIRELAVVRLVTPDGRTFLRDTNQRALEYHVINNSYAFLKSNLHLSLNPEATLHNGSSVIVGVASIIAAQIDHPASWNTYTFDRLICYGVELCRSCWCANVRNRLPINLAKFPTQLRLGQFVAEIKLLPQIGRGRWRVGLPTQGNAFDYEIRRVLRDYGNALFQINNQIYAMWCKDNFYYLLDPYRHIVVSPQAQKNSMKLKKFATVRMFRDVCGMLNVFHQLLKESNRHAPFYLHVVRIKNIAKCPHGYALKPRAEDAYCELKPINEPIDFPQQLGKCARQLAEISDFEPDMISTTEDATELETLKLVSGPDRAIEPAEEVGLEKVQVEVEVETIKPVRFRRDINNEKTNFDKKRGGVANTKANFQTQMSNKPKMAILAAAASLKPPKVPPSAKPPRSEGGLEQLVAPAARQMAPRMKRKGFQADTVSTLAKKVKSRGSQEQEQEQQPVRRVEVQGK